MIAGKNKRELFDTLSLAVRGVLSALSDQGENPDNYKGFNKIINICGSYDMGGVKNIDVYLNGESRVIYDNGLFNSNVDNRIRLAISLADKLAES